VSIEPDRDQFFQYATYGVVGLTLVICLCYSLVFLNPRVNPIGALQPPTVTVVAKVFELPPTWTPTATVMPTDTPTDTLTEVPTLTPLPTNTPRPTATQTSTRVPPTRVPPTRRPPAPPPPAPPLPSPIPAAAHFVQIKVERSKNCGTWYLQGTVWDQGYGQGFVPGTLVRVWVGDAIYATDTAGSHNRNNPAYWEVLFPDNQAQDGSVGIVDGNGNLLSPRYAFHLTKGCTGASSVNEIIMDFARQ
jgi:hypothetical protein